MADDYETERVGSREKERSGKTKIEGEQQSEEG